MTKTTVQAAQSALHDLYGLVPEDQRKWADDYVRVVEQALYGYDRLVDFQRAVEGKLTHVSREQGLIRQRIAEIEG